ncbi:MAG: hypothetical protein OXI69_16765 [Acidobacteriota bacterium]|nr:hypothetical protein [Acidobacteriota bacterium]
MNISPELIAIAILGVSLVSLGWKVTGDLSGEIHLVREDVADLRERMARLEGLFEGFTRGELIKEKK